MWQIFVDIWLIFFFFKTVEIACRRQNLCYGTSVGCFGKYVCLFLFVKYRNCIIQDTWRLNEPLPLQIPLNRCVICQSLVFFFCIFTLVLTDSCFLKWISVIDSPQKTKSDPLSEIRFNIRSNIWSDIQSTVPSNTTAYLTSYLHLKSFSDLLLLHIFVWYFCISSLPVTAWPVYLSLRQPSTYDWLSDDFKINLNPKLRCFSCKSKMHPQSSSHWPLP